MPKWRRTTLAALSSGIHVATACKLACGTSLSLWQEIKAACEQAGIGLRRQGDRWRRIASFENSCASFRRGWRPYHAVCRDVMSGSASPGFCSTASTAAARFPILRREAHAMGYTEPGSPRGSIRRGRPPQNPDPCAIPPGFPLESGCVFGEFASPRSVGSSLRCRSHAAPRFPGRRTSVEARWRAPEEWKPPLLSRVLKMAALGLVSKFWARTIRSPAAAALTTASPSGPTPLRSN